MSKIQIMTDSASDISCADEQKYSIEVIPFPVTLGDRAYTSRVDLNNERFFRLMAQYSIDGMGYNALYGSPVVHAAQMCIEGDSLEEILG